MKKVKILAVLLAIMAAVCIFAFSVSAEDETTVADDADRMTLTGLTVGELEAMLKAKNSAYEDKAEYPWAVFQKYSSGWAVKGAYPLFANDDNNLISNEAELKGGTFDETVVLRPTNALNASNVGENNESFVLLRRDYTFGERTIRVQKDDGTVVENYKESGFHNFGGSQGKVNIDFGPYTFDRKDGSIINLQAKHVPKANQKISFNINNGILKGTSSLIAIIGSDNNYKATKTYELVLNNVTWNSGANVVSANDDTPNYAGKNSTQCRGIISNIIFNDCTFDMTSNTTLFNLKETVNATKLAAWTAANPDITEDLGNTTNITVNGGTFKFKQASVGKIYACNADDSVVFGKGADGEYAEVVITDLGNSLTNIPLTDAVQTVDAGEMHWAGYTATYNNTNASGRALTRTFRLGNETYETSKGTAYIPLEYAKGSCGDEPWLVFINGQLLDAYPLWYSNDKTVVYQLPNSTTTVNKESYVVSVLQIMYRYNSASYTFDILLRPDGDTHKLVNDKNNPIPVKGYTDPDDGNPILFYDSGFDNLSYIAPALNLDLGGHTLNTAGKALLGITIKQDGSGATQQRNWSIKNGTVNVGSGKFLEINLGRDKNSCGNLIDFNVNDVKFNMNAGGCMIYAANGAAWSAGYDNTNRCVINATFDGCTFETAGSNPMFDIDFVPCYETATTKTNVVLTNCDLTKVKTLSYTNKYGNVTVGTVKYETIKPGMALSLYNDIAPIFRLPVGAYTAASINLDGKTFAGEIVDIGGVSYFVFKTARVSPDKIANAMSIRVTAVTADGYAVCGEASSVSIKDYCDKALDGSVTNANGEKELIAAMLEYAAAAQKYVASENNTTVAEGDLLNKDIPASITLIPADITNPGTYFTDGNGAAVDNLNNVIEGISIGLNNGIRIKFKDQKNYEIRIKVEGNTNPIATIWGGENGSAMAPAEDETGYYIYYGGLSAAQLRKKLTIEICLDGNLLGSAVGYSFETYAYNKYNAGESSQELKDLVQAMMTYGKYAFSYMDSKSNGGNA